MEKLSAEFDEFNDGSVPVLFLRKGSQWYCGISDPPEAQKIKGIQPMINLYPPTNVVNIGNVGILENFSGEIL